MEEMVFIFPGSKSLVHSVLDSEDILEDWHIWTFGHEGRNRFLDTEINGLVLGCRHILCPEK